MTYNKRGATIALRQSKHFDVTCDIRATYISGGAMCPASRPMPSSFCGRGGRGDAKAVFAVRVEYGRRIVYNRKNMPDAVRS